MRLGTAIEHLVEAYKHASDKEWIQDKVAWALYHTWKEADDRKTEPQTNADQHVQHVGSVESVEPTWTKEEHEAFYTFLWNVINPNEMQDYIEMFETKDEPQTERSRR